MLTTIIVLAAFLLCSVVAHMFQSANISAYNNEIALKDRELLRYRTDKDDATAFYRFQILNDGIYRVTRITYPDGENAVETTIKLFNTSDAEYNHNEAVELVDKLNERLCYEEFA